MDILYIFRFEEYGNSVFLLYLFIWYILCYLCVLLGFFGLYVSFYGVYFSFFRLNFVFGFFLCGNVFKFDFWKYY